MALGDDNRARCISCFDLAHLDDAEVFEGYRDGLAGEPCGNNRSRSYAHGHRNGMIDSRRIEQDALDRLLARDFAPGGDTNVGRHRVAYWRAVLAAQTRH